MENETVIVQNCRIQPANKLYSWFSEVKTKYDDPSYTYHSGIKEIYNNNNNVRHKQGVKIISRFNYSEMVKQKNLKDLKSST